MLLHTRAATNGSPSYRVNNHPIAVAGGKLVGVHNGVIWNDDTIFRTMGLQQQRIGEVDSEAIFAAIAYGRELDTEFKPLLADSLDGVFKALDGSAAIAWMQTSDPEGTLHLARISQSPLVLAQTAGGSLLFASTKHAIEDAAALVGLDVDWWLNVDEGTYFKVHDGAITDYFTWEQPKSTTWSTRSWGYGGHTFGGWDDDLEDWQRMNNGYAKVIELGPKSKDDDETDDADVSGEEEFALSPWLDGGYLLYGNGIPSFVADKYDSQYADREEDIRNWYADNENLSDQEAVTRTIDYHVWLRPGDYVITSVFGHRVYAQVVDMPNRFPGGVYYLMAFIPSTGRVNTYEKVFVAKRDFEFTSTTKSDRVDIIRELGRAVPVSA